MQRIAVFASGGGSNLQALLEHFNGSQDRGARVVLVVSERAGAGALERARRSAVETRVVAAGDRPPGETAQETLDVLNAARIDIVALAGYLKLLPAAVVQQFRGRIFNVHPALLPAFGGPGMYGMRVHRAVLEAGCYVTGVTVHHVDERYDEGRPLAQWPVPVLHGDTAETLAARVLRVEHLVYPLALEVLARRLAMGHAAAHGFAGEDNAGFAWTNDVVAIRQALWKGLCSGAEDA